MLTTLHLGLIPTTDVTEDPTTNEPSSVVRRTGHNGNPRGSPNKASWGGQMTWASVLRGKFETEEELLDRLSEE